MSSPNDMPYHSHATPIAEGTNEKKSADKSANGNDRDRLLII